MFWKNTAWSWDDAAGNDDDDGGCLLAADLRRTPDSAPDTDSLNRMAAATTANLSNSTTVATGLGDLSNRSLTSSCPQSFNPTTNNTNYSSYMSTLYTNANQRQATRNSGSIQQLTAIQDQDQIEVQVQVQVHVQVQDQTNMHTIHRLCRVCIEQNLPQVNIARGKDGFGFTICSDCPVRVQAVDSGGPAHQSGLRQGDSVLQLNGVPVETWKCVDLAHAIRSCPSQIVLVVWRGLPELRSGCEALLRPPTHNTTTGRKLLPHPAHSKHGHRRRRGQRLGVRSSLGSLGSLGSLWRDRKEEQDEEDDEEDEEEQEVFSPRTATLKGTRVTSSHGDNYIILSPVSPGGQLLQPVYHDRNGTIGRLYQTHPSRGQNLLHDPRPSSSQRTFSSRTSTLPPPPSTSSSSSSSAPQPGNYGNYQNCTIVQSHLPCSSYGTYITLAPKTLIFPVFVQPLDLCSPDRTLLMAEEMILHQNDQLPAKVTVLIYSDLLLFTREDEAGRCNVLQSPVYLNALQLREAPSEPLLLHLLQMTPMSQMSQTSQTSRHRLFSLEAFSIEQKVRVSLCLHDNIQLQQQLVATDTERHAHHHQLSDLPSDFGLLSLRPSDLLFRPSSPFSSPDPEEEERKKRRREELVEERQQGEGESASETSESVGGVGGRGLLLSPHHFNMKEEEEEETDEDEEEEEEEGGVLRRSLSEGSLLQEPRSPRFLSDSTIHRLTCPATLDPDLDLDSALRRPSIQSLRKQLTREGGTLHQLLLLLNRTKVQTRTDENRPEQNRPEQTRKEQTRMDQNRTDQNGPGRTRMDQNGPEQTRTDQDRPEWTRTDQNRPGQTRMDQAADVRSRLLFLRRRKNSACVHGNSLEKALRNNRPSAQEVLRWAESLEALLTNQYGLAVFRHFLRSEFSEENLDFWLAVERFKRTRPLSKMATRAAKIYDEFISTDAARQVNVDSSVRESTNQSLCLGVSPASFQLAQDQIFGLMESDSYPRFLRSRLYAQLANQGTKTAAVSAN
ncbi:regulator of G-protein signaling 3-like [Symphorus nematophorus]